MFEHIISQYVIMSLATFKKKTINNYSSATKISGKPPGGIFLPQGPFGNSNVNSESNTDNFLSIALNSYSPEGFSLNGSRRNVGYVGKTYKFSKNGTPFRGIYPMGSGSRLGGKKGALEYLIPTQPVFNVNEVIVLGDQYKYVKPTVISNFAMLRKKYRWAYYGQYPNFWVQPNYGSSNQSETKSQGNYVHDLSVSNTCVTDVNNPDKYVGFIKRGGGTLCHTTPALFKYNDVARYSLYTKSLYQPLDASQQTMRVQRKCAHPTGSQKPFPYATSGSTCNQTTIYYLAPPEWYIKGDNAPVI